MFFIVSGFVIPWSLRIADYHWRHAPLYLTDPPYFACIALILLLHWIAAVAGWHARPFHLDWGQLVSHIAYATAVLGEHGYQPVFWTLAIEFLFYLLLALLYPMVASPRRTVRWTLMAVCLAAYLPWREAPEVTFAHRIRAWPPVNGKGPDGAMASALAK